MNTIYTNIDISNARRLTKYPFTFRSTCTINNMTFNNRCIKSFSICVLLAIFPLFIKGIKKQKLTILLLITSIDRTFDASIHVTLLGSIYLIKNKYELIIGTVAVLSKDYMYNFFASNLNNISYLLLSPLSFIIAPLCIKCVNYNTLRYLKVGNNTLKRNVNIYFGNNCFPHLLDSNNITISVAGDLDLSYEKIKKLKTIKITNGTTGDVIAEEDCTSKNIILKHTMLSDLRVITKLELILLAGVIDVS